MTSKYVFSPVKIACLVLLCSSVQNVPTHQELCGVSSGDAGSRASQVTTASKLCSHLSVCDHRLVLRGGNAEVDVSKVVPGRIQRQGGRSEGTFEEADDRLPRRGQDDTGSQLPARLELATANLEQEKMERLRQAHERRTVREFAAATRSSYSLFPPGQLTQPPHFPTTQLRSFSCSEQAIRAIHEGDFRWRTRE
eukprot:3928416-Rhodomonas_salina.2